MNFKSFYLLENLGNELVVVDIQPAYEKYIKFDIYSFIKTIKESEYKKILYLFNGPDLGYESENDIKDWLYEIVEYDDDLCEFIQTFKFYEKIYGFYRDLMDSDYDVNEMIKLIRYMMDRKLNDSRDLEEDDWVTLKLDDISPNSLYIPDVVDILKNHNNIHLCGGGKEECLKEVQICLDVLNKDYVLLNKWVY